MKDTTNYLLWDYVYAELSGDGDSYWTGAYTKNGTKCVKKYFGAYPCEDVGVLYGRCGGFKVWASSPKKLDSAFSIAKKYNLKVQEYPTGKGNETLPYTCCSHMLDKEDSNKYYMVMYCDDSAEAPKDAKFPWEVDQENNKKIFTDEHPYVQLFNSKKKRPKK